MATFGTQCCSGLEETEWNSCAGSNEKIEYRNNVLERQMFVNEVVSLFPLGNHAQSNRRAAASFYDTETKRYPYRRPDAYECRFSINERRESAEKVFSCDFDD